MVVVSRRHQEAHLPCSAASAVHRQPPPQDGTRADCTRHRWPGLAAPDIYPAKRLTMATTEISTRFMAILNSEIRPQVNHLSLAQVVEQIDGLVSRITTDYGNLAAAQCWGRAIEFLGSLNEDKKQ